MNFPGEFKLMSKGEVRNRVGISSLKRVLKLKKDEFKLPQVIQSSCRPRSRPAAFRRVAMGG